MKTKWYWIIVLIIVLLLGSLIPSRPNLSDLERFNKVVEPFGFEDDKSADWELVRSGLNDCNPTIGSGDGIRDMFDFSNRFIEAQMNASNDIPVVQRGLRECK